MKQMAQVAFASLDVPTTESPTTTQPHAAVPWSGIRALMLAVLEDAIHNLRSSDSLVRAEAEQWITSGQRRYVFSFAVICETLNLEPSAVRRSVIRLLDATRSNGRLLPRSRPNVRRTGAMQPARAARQSAGRRDRRGRFCC
jgi:hypothetical protein